MGSHHPLCSGPLRQAPLGNGCPLGSMCLLAPSPWLDFVPPTVPRYYLPSVPLEAWPWLPAFLPAWQWSGAVQAQPAPPNRTRAEPCLHLRSPRQVLLGAERPAGCRPVGGGSEAAQQHPFCPPDLGVPAAPLGPVERRPWLGCLETPSLPRVRDPLACGSLRCCTRELPQGRVTGEQQGPAQGRQPCFLGDRNHGGRAHPTSQAAPPACSMPAHGQPSHPRCSLWSFQADELLGPVSLLSRTLGSHAPPPQVPGWRC